MNVLSQKSLTPFFDTPCKYDQVPSNLYNILLLLVITSLDEETALILTEILMNKKLFLHI